jgi:7,8-dihydro-6-hydroxymethylpterin-pyrophosphokinase
VAICTLKSPQEILDAIHAIEEKLGRIRTNATGYQARSIDIDIVSFNNEHIETPSLQIPHPQMQNRLFVLLPMNDLKVDFVHPILGKNTSELIAECPDTCEWSVISELPKNK